MLYKCRPFSIRIKNKLTAQPVNNEKHFLLSQRKWYVSEMIQDSCCYYITYYCLAYFSFPDKVLGVILGFVASITGARGQKALGLEPHRFKIRFKSHKRDTQTKNKAESKQKDDKTHLYQLYL